ncbi:hypothetical protein [Ornithinibacillus scapharcae]|uniref:hypothetical protein n=1 Tax=Ornithinibacillus scapharcae TaxID=1147159 RepID=UPI000225ADEA|nr:hypothetical protein [Ornithinibacillus scapharcae]
MPKTTYLISSLLLLFIIILSVFDYQSDETVIQQAAETAKDTFLNDVIPEDNYKGEHFSFYLPEQMEVEEVDAHNAILVNGDQTLIVFYNTLEDDLSELNFEAAKTDKAALLTSFTNEEMFAYIRLLPQETDNESYEIQVGVGGVKVTTLTNKGEMVNDAKNLMKIAESIVR